MARTGISRATLNNYIGLNLIPSPTVRKPKEPGGPTKIGYFPEWVVERIEKIQQFKGQGMRMPQIVMHFLADKRAVLTTAAEPGPVLNHQWLNRIVVPAVLVGQTWEIIGLNNRAEELFFGENRRGVPSPVKHTLVGPSFIGELENRFGNWKEILAPHIRLAKRDVTEDILQDLHFEGEYRWLNEAMQLWHEAEIFVNSPFTQQTLTLEHLDGKTEQYTLISCPMPEGILLLYAPAGMQLDQLMDLLSGKAKISKSVLLRKAPSLTPLCILAASLESDLQLRTALPPAEYFDLMNQVILGSHRCFKDHGGIPGSSFREGVVCFFLPEADSRQDYFFQPLVCAQSLQKMVSDLNRQWKHRQAWRNALRLNIAIHCGHEWLGTIPSPLAFEFTVVGDTLMETEKLGEFSQRGAIWASKKVIENLSPSHRKRVEFGIRLGVYQDQFVSPNIYSPVSELLGREELERRGLQAIGNLAVTEVMNVLP
ncbi:MAG: hypothetical protein KJP05_10345 [Deltaproteobacteria bacterium]|nr:hypothetical protein [Deltaproteobacteria bacterium]